MNRISMLIIADVIVASCVVEEGPLVNAGSPEYGHQGFVVTVVPFTRSGEPDKNVMPDDRFGLFAFRTGDEIWDDCSSSFRNVSIMNGFAERLEGLDNQYISSGAMDDASQGLRSFFAYSPYDAEAEWAEGISFILGTEIGSQTEFLYAGSTDHRSGLSSVGLVFRHALARICVKARSQANEYGHTVRVKSMVLGGCHEGENFFRRGTFDFAGGGIWNELEACSDDPLIFSMDSTHFSSAASALPAEFTALTDEENFIMVLPQDFSETGLPVSVEFNIMDGESILLEDRMECLVYPKLRQGETYSICLDMTPVPITFNPTVDSWISVEI